MGNDHGNSRTGLGWSVNLTWRVALGICAWTFTTDNGLIAQINLIPPTQPHPSQYRPSQQSHPETPANFPLGQQQPAMNPQQPVTNPQFRSANQPFYRTSQQTAPATSPAVQSPTTAIGSGAGGPAVTPQSSTPVSDAVSIDRKSVV